MSDFKYKYSQILSLISQAKKEQLLEDEERKKIKEHIITTEPDLSLEMEKYNKEKDLSSLIETLKLLAGITSMSSPLDSALMNKKKNKQHKRAKNFKLQVDSGGPDEAEVQINECEIGNSPVFQPKKLKNKKHIIK